MNKRWHFQASKRPVTYWFGKIGCAANALLRMLSRFDWFRPNHDEGATSSLMPIRIPIDRVIRRQ